MGTGADKRGNQENNAAIFDFFFSKDLFWKIELVLA